MKKTNSDKLLFSILFFAVAIVVVSQIGLLYPQTRSVLTNIEEYEGEKIKDDITKGEKIVLSLSKGEILENLEIYVNGLKYSDFDEPQKEIFINQTSVVEILSENENATAFVEIKSISEKLYDATKIGKVRIDKGFNMVGRFVK